MYVFSYSFILNILSFQNHLKELNQKKISHNVGFVEKVPYVPEGLEAVVFTADGDMRQALNNLQATFSGFEFVNQDNVFKVSLWYMTAIFWTLVKLRWRPQTYFSLLVVIESTWALFLLPTCSSGHSFAFIYTCMQYLIFRSFESAILMAQPNLGSGMVRFVISRTLYWCWQ